MKTISLIGIYLFVSIVISNQIIAQVRTKIYPEGLPEIITKKHIPYNEVSVNAPINFETLLKRGSDIENSAEFKTRFAEIVDVDYEMLAIAKLSSFSENSVYAMKIVGQKALNLSLQFNEFNLSPNAVLSIYTDFEITDSITAKENNPNKIWATRVYQGNIIYITLSVPLKEESQIKLRINKMGFGYRQIGGGFFGNPGTSGNCNINVLCPVGTGWEDERNSVALIVSGGDEICTGTLVMNTCNNNIPYLLTANHCLNSNVANWVFQFQTWSTDCNTNIGWREDVQFNGCQLRANNAATDFALVELNQTPPANSGITYSGWTRDPNPAIRTTGIHHPMGDLMKICHDLQAPVSVSWGSGASNHWRAIFDQGIVQHGSSGSALYDENNRILGQLHGNYNNICNIGDNNCFCTVQIPSIGEYGRFDISWTGGGTNTTRLSNWLDPNNSNAQTTNTTNIANLALPQLTLSITGGNTQICTGSSTYTLNGAPVGANIVWGLSNSNATLTAIGNQATVTKINNGDVTLTATVGNNSPCYPNWTSKTIKLGSYSNYEVQINGPYMVPLNYTTSYSYDQSKYNISNITWLTPATPGWICFTGCTNSYYAVLRSPSYASTGNINMSFSNCGTNNIIATKWVAWGYGGPAYRVSPNPANHILKIEQIDSTTNKTLAQTNIQLIEIIDKMGTVVYRQTYSKGTPNGITIPVGRLRNDIYTVRIFDGEQWKSHKVSVQH